MSDWQFWLLLFALHNSVLAQGSFNGPSSTVVFVLIGWTVSLVFVVYYLFKSAGVI